MGSVAANVAAIVEKARSSWLKNNEVLDLLEGYVAAGLSVCQEPPVRPEGGCWGSGQDAARAMGRIASPLSGGWQHCSPANACQAWLRTPHIAAPLSLSSWQQAASCSCTTAASAASSAATATTGARSPMARPSGRRTRSSRVRPAVFVPSASYAAAAMQHMACG